MADFLIVDDDQDVATVLKEFLCLEGHAARLAFNGREGLARIEEKKPDVILLDVEMPVMNGPDMSMTLFVRDAGREKIPIVLLSGSADLCEVAREMGTPYFLAKPYCLDRFSSLLSRALTERRAPVRK